jgi:hypothetical protein
MKQQLHSLFLGGIFTIFIAYSSSAQTVRAGLDFDGVNDIVVIPHNASLNLGTGAFTIEAWIQADPSQEYNPMILFKKDTIIGSTGMAFGLTDKGRLAIATEVGAFNSGGFGSSAVDLRDGVCHHVVYTRDLSGASDTLRAYIDGVLQKRSVKGLSSADLSYATNLHIGWSDGGFAKGDYPFNGMIKEVRMWNITRSEAEINATMDKFLKGTEAGLIGYWRLNENTGQEVKDYSKNKNHGTLGKTAGADGNDPAAKDFCDVINDVLPPVGISETEEANTVVYPNPVKEVLYFNLVNSERLNRLSIYNAMGQLVYDQLAPKDNQLDVSDFEQGIYFYEMTLTNGRRLTDRFIKE